MMSSALSAIFPTLWAVLFLVVMTLLRSLFSLSILPRLSFSKTGLHRVQQLPLRWLLLLSRLRVNIKRDLPFLVVLSLQVTCLALFPINGERGLQVENPHLVLMILTLISCAIHIIASWKATGPQFSETSIDHITYFTTRALIVLILFLGAALGQTPGELNDFLGREWLFLSSPFHFVAFLLGIFVATFFKSSSSKNEKLISLDVFVDHLFSLTWLTLVVMIFCNSNALPGLSHFIFLISKVLLLYVLTDIFWKHFPVLRRDQLEKIMLATIYPITFLCFAGMWWMKLMT
ncbi:MAG: hypothetical protein AB7F59_01015 [Bdellovibrionales bacterium]